MIRAPISYAAENEQRYRDQVDRELRERQRTGAPVRLQSPNGTTFELTVDDTGALSAVEVTR